MNDISLENLTLAKTLVEEIRSGDFMYPVGSMSEHALIRLKLSISFDFFILSCIFFSCTKKYCNNFTILLQHFIFVSPSVYKYLSISVFFKFIYDIDLNPLIIQHVSPHSIHKTFLLRELFRITALLMV